MKPRAVVDIDVDLIFADDQARTVFDEDELAGLRASMAAVGLKHPLLLRAVDDRFNITDGQRRWLCAKALGWKTVPAIVDYGAPSDADVITTQLVTAAQRAALRPCEQARAIDKLMRETNRTAVEVATSLGFSPPKVSRARTLLLLPLPVQRLIDENRLSASAGYLIAKTRDPAERARLLEEATSGRLTRDKVMTRAVARPSSSAKVSTRSRTRRTRERVVIALGAQRSMTVVGPSLTVPSLIEWIEELLRRVRALGATPANLDDLARALREDGPLGAGQ